MGRIRENRPYAAVRAVPRVARVHGFSLVEIMVVLAIMAIVALGISQMFVDQAKQQATIQRKSNYQQLVMTVQSAASSAPQLLNSMSMQTCVCTNGQPCDSQGKCSIAAQPMDPQLHQ